MVPVTVMVGLSCAPYTWMLSGPVMMTTGGGTHCEGGSGETQVSAPFWQAVTPVAQGPASPVEHGAPPPGFPSSTAPLQSLSMPSQTSAETVFSQPSAGLPLQSPKPALHAVIVH